MTDTSVLLSGIVGSTAYGLATPTSDVDRLGVFAAPTADLLGLHRHKETVVTTGPDSTFHEAGKLAALCLAGNPTVTELLWLESYEVRTGLGADLVGIRDAFLSAKRVRDAYLGYATQQFKRLENRGDGSFSADTRKRTAKHARHLARLVSQGTTLYETGHLQVRLPNPDWYHQFGERVAAGNLSAARWVLADAEARFDRARSPLPDRPDEATVEKWLRAVRAAHYEPEPPPRPASGVWLVDLDGTVAKRDPAAQPRERTPYEWARVGEDLPNTPVIAVVQALAAAGHPIIYMSGRSAECAPATGVWIAAHLGVPGVALLMRPAGDHRPDDIVKRELYDRHIHGRGITVAGVLDDRSKVVRMWRDLGLTVLQVDVGDF